MPMLLEHNSRMYGVTSAIGLACEGLNLAGEELLSVKGSSWAVYTNPCNQPECHDCHSVILVCWACSPTKEMFQLPEGTLTLCKDRETAEALWDKFESKAQVQ